MSLSDNHLTLIVISTIFWGLVYIACKLKGITFADALVSNLHSIPGCILAVATIIVNDERILKESFLLSWTQGYFIIDLLYCIGDKDIPFTFHAICSLGLTILNSSSGKLYALNANSKGFLCELSSPFYQRWVKSKKKSHFQQFCFMFFVFRIVYIPIFLYSCREGITKTVAFGSAAFYLLNFAWFLKGLKMLLNYKEKKRS
jgi:hypothetical protein